MAERIVIRGALVAIEGRLERTDIEFRDGLVAAIGTDAGGAAAQVVSGDGLYVMPGFFDIHTHGAVNVDFNHADADQVRSVCQFFASKGVTNFLPTILTDTVDTMCRQLSVVTDANLMAECPQIAGVHLEGPFLCRQYKGAMPEHLLQSCDYDLFKRLQSSARGQIKVLTLAPELPGAVELTALASASGVRVSLGHSASSYDQAMAAIKAGAVGTTHIMNAMKLMHMHDPAILTAVLESDVHAEMICDGIHLHAPIVRFLVKAKGHDRMIAVTDSIMAAGCPDGEYVLGPNAIVVEHGDAKVIGNGARAGSTLTMDRALRNLVSFTGEDPGRLAPLMAANAAHMLGLSHQVGSFSLGKRADAVVLDEALEVVMTIARGRVVYSRDERI